jgi:methanogenic corrinoid protein MtbC1
VGLFGCFVWYGDIETIIEEVLENEGYNAIAQGRDALCEQYVDQVIDVIKMTPGDGG